MRERNSERATQNAKSEMVYLEGKERKDALTVPRKIKRLFHFLGAGGNLPAATQIRCDRQYRYKGYSPKHGDPSTGKLLAVQVDASFPHACMDRCARATTTTLRANAHRPERGRNQNQTIGHHILASSNIPIHALLCGLPRASPGLLRTVTYGAEDVGIGGVAKSLPLLAPVVPGPSGV